VVWTFLTTALIIIVLVAAPSAQQPQTAFNAAPATAGDSLPAPMEIDLLVGRSTVLNVGATIARVSLTVPDIADAMVTAPSQILIHGKQPGTISLFVWDKAGAIKTYEVNVRRDLKALKEHLAQLFPGEPIEVRGSGKDVVLSGTVSGQYAIEKAANVAGGYVEKKENVVNLLKQQEGVASNQVMLRVRFAEVSRSALQELGASFVANAYKSDWFGRTTTGQFPAPEWDQDGKLVFSDFLNLFVLNTKEGLGAVVRALSNKGLFQSLAEPNLIATNGKEASFLAGGEYPYPIAQPTGGGVSYSIQFKEFGVRLRFTPTVLGGDLVNLKVEPEVSALDFTNAIILEGFRVPALSTRRTQTEVELRDGQTFAIAGLMNNTLTSSMSKIPGIGDIPILGLLFRSKAHQKNQTELVVMITPTILRRGSMGVSDGLPSNVEPFLGAPDKRLPAPAPYTGSPRFPANRPVPRDPNMTDASQPVPSAPATATAAQPADVAAPGVLRAVPQAEPAEKAAMKTPRTDAAPIAATAPAATAPAANAPAANAPAANAPVANAPVANAPVANASVANAPVANAPAPRKPTKDEIREEKRLADEMRKAEEKAAKQRAEEEKRQQEADKAAAKRVEKERQQAEKLAKEREKREAEVAKKNAEIARKKAEEDAKKEKAIAEAAARLKEAQAAYEAQVDKVKRQHQ
jgi:pilus assembly protein CpaC